MSSSINRQAGGYKATINNPNRSEETKEAAREKLENLENSEEYEAANSGEVDMTGKNEGNVLGGYKATLKNPRVSEEAKQHAQEVLEEHDAI